MVDVYVDNPLRLHGVHGYMLQWVWITFLELMDESLMVCMEKYGLHGCNMVVWISGGRDRETPTVGVGANEGRLTLERNRGKLLVEKALTWLLCCLRVNLDHSNEFICEPGLF